MSILQPFFCNHIPATLKISALLLSFCLFAPLAFGQGTGHDHQAEIFLGFSVLNAQPDSLLDSFSMNGGHVEVFVPFSRKFGAVLDVSGHTGTVDAPVNIFGVSEIELNQFAILTGIRYEGFQWKSLQGAFRLLVGAATGSVKTDLSDELWVESTNFAAAFGGSLTLALSDLISLRLIQPNLLVTTFGGESQTSKRFSAGLVVNVNR